MIAVGVLLLGPWFPSLPLAFLKDAVASNQNSPVHYWKRIMRSQGRFFNDAVKWKKTQRTANDENPRPINSQIIFYKIIEFYR